MKSLSVNGAVRALLAITFFVSGIAKAMSPEAAINLISASFGFSYALTHVLVYTISIFELVLGLLLLFNRFTAPAAFCSTFFFLGAIVVGLHFASQPIDCGCFGNLVSTRTDTSFFVRNVILLTCSMFLLRLHVLGSAKEDRRGHGLET